MPRKGAPDHPDRRIATLADGQHGVVGGAQLRALGLTPGQIENRVRVGRLHSLHRGVYVVGHGSPTPRGRRMAGVLACGADAVLSHRSAAAHWDILRSTAQSIDVTLPRRTGRKPRRGLTVHRVLSLPAEERTMHDGIPVTTVARTLLDLASTLARRGLERAVEESERLRLFDLRAVDAVVQRHPRRAGSGALRAVLGDYRVEHGFTRSELERLFLSLCTECDIDPPTVNAVAGPFEVDFLWSRERVIAETDGHGTHGTRAAFERDRARDAWLTAHGYRVVRFTWRRVVVEPDEVASLVRQLLAG